MSRLVRTCLVLTVSLFAAASARAQDLTLPTITVSPAAGTYPTGAMTVTITWSDNESLNASSRIITFGSDDVTSAFGYSTTSATSAVSIGTVTIQPGSNSLLAYICDTSPLGPNCRTRITEWTGPQPSVRVTADTAALDVPASTGAVTRYRVVNTGISTTTYTLSASCPGTFSACAVSDSAVTLAGGDSTRVDVSFTAPASGSGAVQLTAAAGSASGSASTTVTVQAGADPGFPGDAQSLERIERDACVVIAVGPGTASECGDLRVVHALPGTRVLNKTRTPVLTYNSDHARPHPVVAEHLAGPPGTVPDSIRAVLTVNGTQVASQGWKGWGSAQTRRLAISFDASTLPTGLYPYTLQVTAETGGSQSTLKTRTGRMIIVNRSASPFGAGWWMAGVEQVVSLPGDTLKLWIGGDGSARLYHGAANGPWHADAYDRPDSLFRATRGGVSSVYVRTLPGRAEVWLDAAGRHWRTVNPLQQYTEFRWDSTSTYLQQVLMPYPSAQNDSARYVFEYNNNPSATIRNLSRVAAPGIGGARNTDLRTDATGRVLRIREPSNDSITFGYASGVKWMNRRTDRRGVNQSFGYTGVRFRTAVQPLNATETATTRVVAVLTQGMTGASVSMDSVRYVYDGPRPGTDVCDCAWWKVNRWGAPVWMRDALGNETAIRRGDARWPALATETVAPNGFTTTATYDARGNVTSTTEWNPFGDGRNATTSYTWDPVWDKPTKVLAPEGEIALTAYDSVGRRSWEQAGTSSARRVSYRYYDASHSTGPGLLRAVTSPLLHTDSVAYDARGNLRLTVTPLGFQSHVLSDALGRVVRTTTPNDSAQTVFMVDSTVYDVMDQPIRKETFNSPAGAHPQRLIVETQYDAEGNTLAVSRSSVPDTAHVDTITNSWQYDLAGRAIVEIAPDGARDSTFYDLAGNVVRTRDRRGYSVQAGYDALNRQLWRRTPEVVHGDTTSRGWVFPRYPNCNTTDLCIPADTAQFAYDWAGNLTQADNREARVRRSYFRGGALKTDTLRTRTWAELSAGGTFEAHKYGIHYGYDRNGRRTWMTVPRQLGARLSATPSVVYDSIAYGYDPITGARSSMRDVLGNTFGFTYNVDGSPDRVLYPRGHFKEYSYDPDGRVTRIRQDTTATGGSVNDITLRYDARGKATEVTPFSGHSGYGPDQNGYSGLGALVYREARRPYWGALGPRTDYEAWTVDALGNAVQWGNSYDFKIPTSHGFQLINSSGATRNTYQSATGRLLSSRAFSGSGSISEETGGCSSSQGDSTVRANRFDRAGNIDFTVAAWRHQASGTCYGEEFDWWVGYNMPTRTLSYGSDSAHVHSARYFDANSRLRVVDTRLQGNGRLGLPNDPPGYEDYRYDALGRRVLRRARHTPWVDAAADSAAGKHDLIQRFVWDGDHLLAEVQAPGGVAASAALLETDTLVVSNLLFTTNTEYFGRVLYLAGESIDQPISVVRIGYGKEVGGQFTVWEPITISPHWDIQGRGYNFVAYGPTPKCQTVGSSTECLTIYWPVTLAYGLTSMHTWAQYSYDGWFGSLIQDQLDGTGQLYRRNRYYDPASGRFTQEDPIGLAGGLNVYGFANGDPVGYSDPYGLCPQNAKDGSFCLDFYIAAKTAVGGFIGNDRGTNPNAAPDESKVQVVVSGEGAIQYAHVTHTCRTSGSCREALPMGPGGNEISSTTFPGGSFTVNVKAHNSHLPAVPATWGWAIDAQVTFTPDPESPFGVKTSGNRDYMPTLDIFKRVNGQWIQLPGGQGHRGEKGGLFLAPMAPNDKW